MFLRRPEDLTSRAGRLYDEHGAALYRYALMLLANGSAADDVIQQVFSVLLKRGPAVIDNEAHYLRRAVRNECYSVLRVRVRRAECPIDEPLLESAAATGSDRPDERLALERAIRDLTPEQREVIHMHVYEGRTFQEIADALEESINTVASRYRYAIARLRQILE